MKTIPALTLFAFAMLAGCATPYGPHQLAGGYSNVRIQNDVFRIVFDGNGFIHKSAVDYYALGSVHEFLMKMKAETMQRAAKKVLASLS